MPMQKIPMCLHIGSLICASLYEWKSVNICYEVKKCIEMQVIYFLREDIVGYM